VPPRTLLGGGLISRNREDRKAPAVPTYREISGLPSCHCTHSDQAERPRLIATRMSEKRVGSGDQSRSRVVPPEAWLDGSWFVRGFQKDGEMAGTIPLPSDIYRVYIQAATKELTGLIQAAMIDLHCLYTDISWGPRVFLSAVLREVCSW
jgi:hypothetical protein